MRKPDPVRFCEACGVQLARRRRPGGGLEKLGDFARRARCLECSTGPRAPRPDVDRSGLYVEGRACHGEPLENMFAAHNEQTAPDRIRPHAVRLCLPCPVREECGRVADAAKEQGLWAGVLRMRSGRRYDLLADVLDRVG